MSATQISLPLNQLAFSVIDLQTTERWWREGLGFLPAGGNRLLFRGPVMDAIQGMRGVATTCWCLLGRNDWAQLEMFQYESPISKRMPADFKPHHLGYTRCGVWVADLDAALASLARLGTQPLTPPMGGKGKRRVCVRNPDGVYVELMEDDPLPDHNLRGHLDCPVAIRSVTMSTPDMGASVAFVTQGLGMRDVPLELHSEAHETLWGLAGAICKRKVFQDGSGHATILLEIVEYTAPLSIPWPEGYRVCDQGMLNICFGDAKSSRGVAAMRDRAVAAGARANSWIVNVLVSGCVYVNDPQGFSYEFMWAGPGLGQRQFGFEVKAADARPQLDNQRVECTTHFAAAPAQVWAVLADPRGFSAWAGWGKGVAGGLDSQLILCEPHALLRYRVTDCWLFVGYIGEVRAAPEDVGSRVTWSIRFRSRIPGLGALLRWVLRRRLSEAVTRQLPTGLAPAAPPASASTTFEKEPSMFLVRMVLVGLTISVLVVAAGHALSYFWG